jgi:hypothetical protein
MSQQTSSHRSPGWLKAAAGVGVSRVRESGWLKKIASPLASPAAAAAYTGQNSTQPQPQPPKSLMPPPKTKEEIEAQRVQQMGQRMQQSRAVHDHQARFFKAYNELLETVPPEGLTEEQQKEFEQILVGEMQKLEKSGFGEKDLADLGFARNRNYTDTGEGAPFVPVGSGRGTKMDVDMAKQHFAQQKSLEDAYISGDPEKIREAEFYDQHDFIGGTSGQKNFIPKDLDNAQWGPQGMAMVDYSGGSERKRRGRTPEIGAWENMKMQLATAFQGDSADAKIHNRRADDDLKSGDWNSYEENLRRAQSEAQAVGDEETLKWLNPKIQNLEKDRRSFGLRQFAERFANGSSVKTPDDYQMPPRPPEKEFPEAAAMWDDVAQVREFGAKIPFMWEDEWGEEPAPIRENWKSWTQSKTDPYTGEVTYEGERRPEHQKLLDKKLEREKKAYEESGRAAADQRAKAYDDEMVDPQQQLLADYYSTDDPKVRDRVQGEWKARKDYKEVDQQIAELRKGEGWISNRDEIERLEEHKQQLADGMKERGYSQQAYDTARDADQLRVDEWDQKARGLTAEYFKNDALKGSYKTKEDYIEAAMGQQPPELVEARQRVGERRKNEGSLRAHIERTQKAFREEEDQTKQFEEAALLSQYESGNAPSERDAKSQAKEMAQNFLTKTREVRVRANKAALAGNYDEAAELMARRDIMFRSGMKAAEGGGLTPEAVKRDLDTYSDDKAWGEVRDTFMKAPENRDIAQSYIDSTKKFKEDFTNFHSTDPAQRIEVVKNRIARFDTGEAQRLGITPGQQPGQSPQPGQQPGQAVAGPEELPELELPPIGQPKPGEVARNQQQQGPQPNQQIIDELNRPWRNLPPAGAYREDPAATQPVQPQQPQPQLQPQQSQQQAQQPPPQKSLKPTRLQQPAAGDTAQAPPTGANPQGNSAFMPAVMKYDENGNPTDYYGKPLDIKVVNPVQKYDPSGNPLDADGKVMDRTPVLLSSGAPAGASPTPAGGLRGGQGSLLPGRFRPNTEPGNSIAAGSSRGETGAPPVPSAPLPQPDTGKPGQQPGQPAAKPGSLAPSNAEQAGIGKPQTPQVGLNKKGPTQIGNPNGFSGTGNNRVSLDGRTPAQTAHFTVGTQTKSLNQKLFPMKSPAAPLGTGGGLKLADFKGAKYLANQETGLDSIPLVGGMLDGMVRGVDNAQYFAQRGKWGRSALGVGQFGLNAGLLASSVIPVGSGASWAARGAFHGGRALLGGAAARQAGSLALKGLGTQARNGVVNPLINTAKSFSSIRGTAGTLRGAVANRFTGTLLGTRLVNPDIYQRLSYAGIDSGGQNTSLRDRVRVAPQPAAPAPST